MLDIVRQLVAYQTEGRVARTLSGGRRRKLSANNVPYFLPLIQNMNTYYVVILRIIH